jgi:hypothetical protein
MDAHLRMTSVGRWLFLVLAVLVVGTGLFLVAWDIEAPTGRVEVTLPDERFPR